MKCSQGSRKKGRKEDRRKGGRELPAPISLPLYGQRLKFTNWKEQKKKHWTLKKGKEQETEGKSRPGKQTTLKRNKKKEGKGNRQLIIDLPVFFS